MFVVAAALVLAGVPRGASAQLPPLVITIVSGNNQAGTINAPLPAPLVVRVTQSSEPVMGATVTWSVTSGSGTLVAPTSVTDTNGQASNTLTPTGPTTQVTAAVVIFTETSTFVASVTFTATATVPPLATAIVSGNNQAGTINAPLPAPLVVRVTQGGVPVAGATVAWSVTSGSGTLAAPTTGTDASGQASNTLTPTGPTTQVTAAVPGASVTFTATATAPPLAIAIVSGNNQVGVINAPLPAPLVVRVTVNGTPAPGETVTWSVTSGAGVLAATTVTNSGGQASNTLTVGATTAAVTVTASARGVSAVFSVNNATAAAAAGLKTFSVMGDVAVTTATVQATNIGLRLASLRRGARGMSVSGLGLSIDGQTLGLGAVVSELPGLGGGASADPSSPFSNLGVFLNGQGSFGNQRATDREPGFTFHTAGVTLGADYRFTPQLILGGAAGYLSNRANLQGAGGAFDTRGLSMSVFGTYYVRDQFYVDSIATYGWNHYDTKRQIIFADVARTAQGATDGRQLALSTGAGYDFHLQALTVGIHGRVNYVHVAIDSFAERGADLFNLRVNDQKIESLASVLGTSISYAVSTPWGVLTPMLRWEWEHEHKGDGRTLRGSLLSDPAAAALSVRTNDPGRDYCNLGAGVTATFRRGISAFTYYETVLGRTNFTNHSFTGGIRFEFSALE